MRGADDLVGPAAPIEAQEPIGPETVTVALSSYDQVRYVSAASGSDAAGNGGRTNPWATINYALSQISDASSSNDYALLVAAGTYAGATIQMKEYVDMHGGFSTSWSRNIFANKTVLDGEHTRRVIIAADNCTLDGFVVKGGRVGGGAGIDGHYGYDHTGCGAGIAIVTVSPTISNNIFTDNRTTRPVPWDPKPIVHNGKDDGWHQRANDGGAISIFDHASPLVANNIFYNNQTEIGSGGAVSSNYYSSPVIINNVFMDNISSTDDPMRSGDGGAINAYEHGYVIIQNNIAANNEAASRNDAGGFAVHWWVSALVKDNVVVNNEGGDDGGGMFFAGQKHHIEDSEPDILEGYLVQVDGNVLMNNRALNSESDPLRTTKLVLAEFTNNIIVEHSEGLYFQNSTVDLFNNTIAGGVRIEDDNYYNSNPRCDTYNNIFLDDDFGSGSNNYQGNPGFVNDGFSVSGSASFDPDTYLTTVTVSGAKYTPGALKKRVVASGGTWSAIKDNTSNTLWIWGDLGGSFTVKQSYHLNSGSPCINAGISSKAPDHDMDNEKRPDPSSGRVDIGADEYASEPIQPQVDVDLNNDGIVNFLDFAALIDTWAR